MAANKAPWQDRAWEFLANHYRQGAKDLHNAIVPAWPSYAHGVDQEGTALNPDRSMTAPKPSFRESLAAQAPAAAAEPAAAKEPTQGMEP
jgi:hypothetical protein